MRSSDGAGQPFEKGSLHPAETLPVTVRVGRDGVRGIPQRPTRPSRIDTLSDKRKRDPPSVMTALVIVEDVVFLSQPRGVDIQLLCQSVCFQICLEQTT